MNDKSINEMRLLLKKEASIANEHYRFHQKHGNKYNLAQWFNGQRALIRKLKREMKKCMNDLKSGKCSLNKSNAITIDLKK